MKKSLVFLFLIILFSCLFFSQEKFDYFKVLEIETPTKIFVDTNKNLLFDETKPLIVDDVSFISKNTDYSADSVLKNLTEEEKFFLDFYANKTAQEFLNNRYINIKNGQIFVGNYSYQELLLSENYFYTNEINSKEKILNFIRSIDLSQYVILNTKSKKHHLMSCIEGRKSKNYKIIKKSGLDKTSKGCKLCVVPETYHILNQLQKNSSIQTDENNSYSNSNTSVFFLGLNEISKPTNKCSSSSCLKLKEQIEEAKETIDFAIYGINNQDEIFNALIKAKNRGVKVRWVSDYDKDGSYYKDSDSLKEKLPQYNDDRNYDENNRAAIMHNKFFIFDNKRVWTGSSNISSTDITGFNSNINIFIDSQEVAKIFTREFEQMYNGKFHKHKDVTPKNEIKIDDNTKISVYFSPQDTPIKTYIIPIIRNAKEYIYMPIFFITRKELIPELQKAYDRGVDIKIINDATNAANQHSIHKALREHGIKVKTENSAGKMHSKTLIIDDKISIIASMNFSNNGELRNDENVVIIQNAQITQYLKEKFMKLWTSIPAKYELFDPRPESMDSVGSCFDGVDNDYDGKIDFRDNGCSTK